MAVLNNVIQLSDQIETNCKHYDENSFKIANNSNHGNFLIYHQNIRSYHKNSNEAFVYINKKLSLSPDVIIFSETWLNQSDVVNHDGYNSYHSIRSSKAGGGVSIFIKSNYKSMQLEKFSIVKDYIELCGTEIKFHNQTKLVVLGVYRPPNSSISDFNITLNDIMNSFPQQTHVYIVGDFNIDLLNPDRLGIDFINNCHMNSYAPLITTATRITNTSATLLDHIWTNQLYDSFSGVLDCIATDHFPIFTKLNLNTQIDSYISKKFRDHSEANIAKLQTEVSSFINELETVTLDVNDKTDLFCTNLYNLYNSCCPIRQKNISLKHLHKPWITDGLLRSLNRKHDLFRKMKRNIVPFEVYNNYKNQLTSLLRKAKKSYYEHRFNQCSGDIKKTWKCLNSLIKAKKTKTSITLSENGSDVVDSHRVSETYNKYFSNIAKELDNKIPLTNLSPLQYMGDPSQNSFFGQPTNPNEVAKIISKFANKSADLNCVPVFIFKSLKNLISPTISKLFNQSLLTGIFPDCLKVAKIIPIFKSGDTKSVTNYRPISMLPFLSKIFERLMFIRLNSFLNMNDTLCDEQFGFRKSSSTSDACVEFLDNTYNAMNDRNNLIAVFLDFSKAFDTVNHDILLQKLNHIGIRGIMLDWFKSYLKNRVQYVSIDSTRSTKSCISLGVPQGSILGPILFLLYINDMSKSSSHLKFVHFADDTTVFASKHNINDLFNTINDELKNIDNWLLANRLSLNVLKTSYMVFTKNTIPNDKKIQIRGVDLTKVSNIKFLGIYIDDKLNFNAHVNQLSNKLSRAVGLMKRMSQILPDQAMLNLYYSLFYSHLTYGIIAWGKSSIRNSKKLASMQKRAWKLLAIHDPKHNLLNYESVYKYFVAVKTHKTMVLQNHNYFKEKFQQLVPAHLHDTRSRAQNNLNIPFFRTNKGQNSFMFQAILTWNNLPASIKIPNISLHVFKKRLKEHLILSQNLRVTM